MLIHDTSVQILFSAKFKDLRADFFSPEINGNKKLREKSVLFNFREQMISLTILMHCKYDFYILADKNENPEGNTAPTAKKKKKIVEKYMSILMNCRWQCTACELKFPLNWMNRWSNSVLFAAFYFSKWVNNIRCCKFIWQIDFWIHMAERKKIQISMNYGRIGHSTCRNAHLFGADSKWDEIVHRNDVLMELNCVKVLMRLVF